MPDKMMVRRLAGWQAGLLDIGGYERALTMNSEQP